MSEINDSPLTFYEESPKAKPVSVVFTDVGLQVEGGKFYEYGPFEGKAGHGDFPAYRRSAAEALIENQGKPALSYEELWKKISKDKNINANAMSRVTAYLKIIEHQGASIFDVIQLKNRGITAYQTASRFQVEILPSSDEATKNAAKVRNLGRIATDLVDQ